MSELRINSGGSTRRTRNASEANLYAVAFSHRFRFFGRSDSVFDPLCASDVAAATAF